MRRSRSSLPGFLVLAIMASVVCPPASAQTNCATPNCAIGATPAICLNRATPRTPIVQMGSGVDNIFVPANPKIELGECIVWKAATLIHSSTGHSCTADSFCNSPNPPVCEWDTGNIDSTLTVPPTSTCYYDPTRFPPAAISFHCRLHAELGTFQITTAIDLRVAKDLGTNSVVLTWTGGGVAGDLSYKVVRQIGGNPRFPVGITTTNVNPDGGVLGTSYVDVGVLTNPATRYYLVRNKQSNEP